MALEGAQEGRIGCVKVVRRKMTFEGSMCLGLADVKRYIHCVSKKGPTLKRYSSKLYGSILMIFGGNIQKSPE